LTSCFCELSRVNDFENEISAEWVIIKKKWNLKSENSQSLEWYLFFGFPSVHFHARVNLRSINQACQFTRICMYAECRNYDKLSYLDFSRHFQSIFTSFPFSDVIDFFSQSLIIIANWNWDITNMLMVCWMCRQVLIKFYSFFYLSLFDLTLWFSIKKSLLHHTHEEIHIVWVRG
jgi:hypothetical protein